MIDAYRQENALCYKLLKNKSFQYQFYKLDFFRSLCYVFIGKIDNQEVDFIATKVDEKKYVQVTESMNAPETRERELAPLRKIRDSYEKIVIALECNLTQTQDGIKIIRALDFLLE